MKRDTSEKLFAEAATFFPGGVNSPVRAFKSVGGTPPFIVRAKGAYVYDADGNAYVDYVGSWGPAILGHAEQNVVNEVAAAMRSGFSFGAPCPREIQLAKKLREAVPNLELMRFVNSGTEATMSAIRAARGFTGRDKIIKFDGCYHGHADYLLVKAGSGAATCGVPDSAGVPASFAEHTLTARYNDLDSVEALFKAGGGVAALIVEPVIGNMGCIPPKQGFLDGLRELCTRHGALLIFDEVMTGFRVAFGGAQALFGVKPDLSCFGKIIGGGLPVGAYGGRKDVMEMIAPLGPVYQAGTLSGNPLAMTAGLATLTLLSSPAVYSGLNERTAQLEAGFVSAAKTRGLPLQFNRVGSMFSFFFSDKSVTDADSARSADRGKFNKVFHALLDDGIYLAPSAFEAGFISAAHTRDDIARTIDAFENALRNAV